MKGRLDDRKKNGWKEEKSVVDGFQLDRIPAPAFGWIGIKSPDKRGDMKYKTEFSFENMECALKFYFDKEKLSIRPFDMNLA